MVSMFMRYKYNLCKGKFTRKATDKQLTCMWASQYYCDLDRDPAQYASWEIMPGYMTASDFIREWRELEAEDRDPLRFVVKPGEGWVSEFNMVCKHFKDGMQYKTVDNKVMMCSTGMTGKGKKYVMFTFEKTGEICLMLHRGQLVTYDRDLVARAIKAA